MQLTEGEMKKKKVESLAGMLVTQNGKTRKSTIEHNVRLIFCRGGKNVKNIRSNATYLYTHA
jgi:hypothetical protein